MCSRWEVGSSAEQGDLGEGQRLPLPTGQWAAPVEPGVPVFLRESRMKPRVSALPRDAENDVISQRNGSPTLTRPSNPQTLCPLDSHPAAWSVSRMSSNPALWIGCCLWLLATKRPELSPSLHSSLLQPMAEFLRQTAMAGRDGRAPQLHTV